MTPAAALASSLVREPPPHCRSLTCGRLGGSGGADLDQAVEQSQYCRSAAIGSVAAGGSAGVAGDDDAVLVGEDDGLHSVSQGELHQEAADVALDGRFRHDQSLGDLAV
jgi:hypothetical protein